MQRKFRLTRSEDFKRVRRSGKSYAHPLVVLIVQAHDQPRLKVGVTAGRTVGTAVYRNRAKRLLREAMRPLLPNIASSLDLILIARRPLEQADYPQLQAALTSLLSRARLLAGGPGFEKK